MTEKVPDVKPVIKFKSIEEALNFGLNVIYNLDNQGRPASDTSSRCRKDVIVKGSK